MRLAILFTFAACCAQAYPMITVDSDGNLGSSSSLHKFNEVSAAAYSRSFADLTASPSSAGTASVTTVASIVDGLHNVRLTVPSDLATNGGVVLPDAVEGKEILIQQPASTTLAYTIWAKTGTTINDATSQTYDAASTLPIVKCQALTTTRWECGPWTTSTYSYKSISTTTTLAHSDAPSFLDIETSGGAFTITLPLCSSPLATTYDYVMRNDNLVKWQTTSPDQIIFTTDLTGGISTAGGSLEFKVGSTLTAAGPDTTGVRTGYVKCVGNNLWLLIASGSNSETAL